MKLWTSAKRVNDVDDEPVSGSSEGKGPRGHQQSHHVEEVGEMCCHVQGVVEGEHEHVPSQNGNIIPHQVLLQRGRGGQTGLVNDFTHPPNHLKREQPFCSTQTRSTAQNFSKNHQHLTLKLLYCLEPILSLFLHLVLHYCQSWVTRKHLSVTLVSKLKLFYKRKWRQRGNSLCLTPVWHCQKPVLQLCLPSPQLWWSPSPLWHWFWWNCPVLHRGDLLSERQKQYFLTSQIDFTFPQWTTL